MSHRRRVKRIKLVGIAVATLGSVLMFVLWLAYLDGQNFTPGSIASMVGVPVFLGALIYVSGLVVDGFHRQSQKQ